MKEKRLIISGAFIAIIRVLYNNNGNFCKSDIAKYTGLTQSHMYRILNEMQKHDLIKMEKVSRKTIVKLTDNGKIIGKNYNNIFEVLSNG